jgi:hypothetical protein
MDHIAQQLRSEILSLEEHINRTGNRLLATHWVDELIEPFEQIENSLEVDDLRPIVIAFHHARNHFKVNGHLADRIDGILSRHGNLVTDLDGLSTIGGTADEYDSVVLPPDADPGDTTAVDDVSSLFFEEDEELVDGRAVALDTDDTAGSTIDFGLDEDESQRSIDFGRDEEVLQRPIDFGRDEDVAQRSVDFGRDTEPQDDPLQGVDFGSTPVEEEQNVDGLFDSAVDTEPSVTPSGTGDELFAQRPPHNRIVDGKSRDSSLNAPGKEGASLYSIFSHVVTVDDLAAGLDVVIPAHDRTLLEQKLRARLSDRVVAALRGSKSAEKQYILVPRIVRATEPTGDTMPMTVKNMAKRYISLFGEIRDLMRYRNDSMMSIEVPESGWAIITAEAPRESLGKNYMEQNQYLRYLSTSLTIPSHLVRRRTMVEAIYDVIVGELVLGMNMQRASLDWTTSTPAKNDYVCVYYPEEGIRVRDLSRVTHHRSLGVTPNW